MPYKSSSIKISGTEYDRRRKLSENDKEEIRRKYIEKPNKRALAREYKVDRRTIDFVVNPERLAAAREAFKERKKKGAYKVTKKERANIMREHRQYKQQLYLRGAIQQQ